MYRETQTVEMRNPEVRRILSNKPPVIIRYGSVAVLVLIAFLFSLSLSVPMFRTVGIDAVISVKGGSVATVKLAADSSRLANLIKNRPIKVKIRDHGTGYKGNWYGEYTGIESISASDSCLVELILRHRVEEGFVGQGELMVDMGSFFNRLTAKVSDR